MEVEEARRLCTYSAASSQGRKQDTDESPLLLYSSDVAEVPPVVLLLVHRFGAIAERVMACGYRGSCDRRGWP